MEQWWVDIGRRKPHKNLSQWQMFYHNSHMNWPATELGAAVLRGRRLIASDMVGLEDFPLNCRPIKNFPFHTSMK
jgi:hypothetical protein